MSIETFDKLVIAFLTETKMSVPSGTTAMRNFLTSEAFTDRLHGALVESIDVDMDLGRVADSIIDLLVHPNR